MRGRPARTEPAHRRLLVAACLLPALVGGCGSDRVVVRTVTVERAAPPQAIADLPNLTDSTSTRTTATTPTSAPDAFARCDANVSAKTPTTTCGFASNAFYEYWTSGKAERIRAYSPATHRVFSARCTGHGDSVECATSDGGVARFARAAIDRYTQEQADAYAAGHDVGPATSSPSGGASTPDESASPAAPPPSSGSGDFCATHDCIPNYDNGNGSTVRCSDGMYSQSGGLRGACSGHGGVG